MDKYRPRGATPLKDEAGAGGERGDVLIPHAKILHGVRSAHESGTRHFADALCLYGEQRAQGAIPSLVLSIEEYLKGTFLAAFHREQKGVSASEWERIQEHKFKLHRGLWPYEALGEGTLAGICAPASPLRRPPGAPQGHHPAPCQREPAPRGHPDRAGRPRS